MNDVDENVIHNSFHVVCKIANTPRTPPFPFLYVSCEPPSLPLFQLSSWCVRGFSSHSPRAARASASSPPLNDFGVSISLLRRFLICKKCLENRRDVSKPARRPERENDNPEIMTYLFFWAPARFPPHKVAALVPSPSVPLRRIEH